MLLSNSCEYGLRALLYLSAEEGEGYVSLREISKRLDISFAFLGKIFQSLNESELTTSRRGPSGGVALARDPTTITLYEVVVALDGEELFTECVLGLPGCGEQEPCPLHQSWAQQRDQLELLFRRATLAETAQETKEQNYRLTSTIAGDELT
ncbi:transcriptional regulator [Salinibacter sp. 10B]|uniref:RrF2 family transcriptional regulator n=1 Tax=Salinibacter sp. 10B TaxID=1923971 RepID=UPI000CF4D1C0|nr:Rrf2 family transcriptional regulator [Salinibacter sp. 10B]PQJ33698.1 transcriptional regulator [Salinibacter sp. 10B]